MHRKIIFVTGLLVLTLFAQTQISKSRIDSLTIQLQNAKEDTSTVLSLIEIGQEYEMYNPDTAMYYYKRAGDISKKIKYPLGIVKYIGNYTDILDVQGRFDESISLNLQAIDISRKNNLFRPYAVSLRNTADAYAYRGSYLIASDYYLQALPCFEKIKDSANLSFTFSNLSKCYASLKMFDKAKEYGEMGIAYAPERWTLANAYLSTGAAIRLPHGTETAMEMWTKSYQLAKAIDDDILMARAMSYIAGLYLSENKTDAAIGVLNEALQHAQKLNDKRDLSTLFKQLGEAYYDKKRLIQAENYFLNAATVAKESNTKGELKAIYKDLAFTETAMGNLQQGVVYDSLYQSINDSLFSVQIAENFQELNIKYQSEKKQNEINTLSKEKAIQDLYIRQNSFINKVLAGGVAALLIIAILLYRNITNTKKIAKQTSLLQTQRIKELETEKQLFATEAILKGQEQERERLAKDLHDGLGGMLSGIKLSLSSIKEDNILDEQSTVVFAKTLQQLNSTIDELRRVAHNMMPEAMVKLGLQQAIQDYCAGLSENNTLQISCVLYGLENRLNPSTEIIIYRIVQELVNNIAKHAAATEALVQIMRNGNNLNITVEDNGIGMPAIETKNKEGAGLRNVQSRVDYLKGSMDIRTANTGTSVHIECNIE
ncbi:MAG: sensor histidine kinase [Agriterribacter sp.]